MRLGFGEILVVAVVILLLFGAKRIPELARSLGKASYEFKKAKNDLMQETRELTEAAEQNAAAEAAAGKKSSDTERS